MKEPTQIVITGYDEIRLTIAAKSITKEQERTITEKAIQFYKGLFHLLHKEDGLDRKFFDENQFRIDLEDEVDSDTDQTTDDDYEEYYEFEYHRYK